MTLAVVLAILVLSIINILRQDSLMSHFGAQYDDLLQAFADNTSKVAARIDTLVKELAVQRTSGDPMTDVQFASFVAIRDHLAALGSDVQMPTPSVPTAVTAPTPEHVTAALEAVPAPSAASVAMPIVAPVVVPVVVAPAPLPSIVTPISEPFVPASIVPAPDTMPEAPALADSAVSVPAPKSMRAK